MDSILRQKTGQFIIPTAYKKIPENYAEVISKACNQKTDSEEDWEKLLPWNIEITPYKIRGEWI